MNQKHQIQFHVELPQQIDVDTITDAMSGVLTAFGVPHSVETTMNEITKTLVADDQRMNFLPNHFGVARMMIVEGNVYRQLRELCEQYGGGMWNFYDLSNGGCFMAPDGEGELQLVNADNFSDETMSHEAAGIVACLYTFGNLSFDPRFAALGEKYHQLYEYMLNHPEAAKIFALID
ncbi:antirestriction protein [Cupriavidus sp. RAF12]|uniref:antirestriction protein n=1 Tax=Cupriavidus sp. RAF12 TaxID=3233050 RepID=UPI003F924A83